jgi:hypothetical protein
MAEEHRSALEHGAAFKHARVPIALQATAGFPLPRVSRKGIAIQLLKALNDALLKVKKVSANQGRVHFLN